MYKIVKALDSLLLFIETALINNFGPGSKRYAWCGIVMSCMIGTNFRTRQVYGLLKAVRNYEFDVLKLFLLFPSNDEQITNDLNITNIDC